MSSHAVSPFTRSACITAVAEDSSQFAHREHSGERGTDPHSSGKVLPGQYGSSPDMGSQGMLFGAGVAVGGMAGALLTYIGSLQRH